MTHDAFAEKLLDLAYGELPPREAGKVEAHAASCEACRAELARIRETRSLMARLPAEPAPEKGERILFAAARQAAEERAPRRRVPPWLWRSSLVAASVVLVVAVSYRIVAMRPAQLESKASDEALLGGPYATPPPAGPTAGAPPEAGAGPEATASAP
ncbi:MAG TPA: zf-HC2 domain-containing protein, partial [Anaeromyxobacter sp.]